MGADLDNILYLDSVSKRKSQNRNGGITGVCVRWPIGRKETSLRHRSVTYEGLVGVSSKSGMCGNCKFPRCSWNKYLHNLTLARNNEKIQTKQRKKHDLVKAADIIPAIRTDHAAITLELVYKSDDIKGPGTAF